MAWLARRWALRRWAAVSAAVVVLAAACDGDEPRVVPAPTATPSSAPSPFPSTPKSSPTFSPSPTVRARFRVDAALGTVRFLAGELGPREATSDAYARAAAEVQRQLVDLGYAVERQRLRVPAGVSWGVPVAAGQTWNVVARPSGFDASQPYRLVGAHLDTVPQAPGAEDNASGVAVMLELARLTTARSRLPVVFVAFAAEEPRGDGEALHHFGSRAYVERMPPEQRRNLAGMISLDRVSVGSVVPVCTGSPGPAPLRSMLLRTARRAGIPAEACTNTSSDHWSFELEQLPAVRIGGTPYPAYHSVADRPRVVNADQLRRVGRLLSSWLLR